MIAKTKKGFNLGLSCPELNFNSEYQTINNMNT